MPAASAAVKPSTSRSTRQAPLLPLRLFRQRTLAGSNAVGFLLGASFYSFIFTGTLYMQQVLGYSALTTGLAWLATSVNGIALAGPAQLLVTRASVRLVMAAGMALVGCAIGIAIASTVAATHSRVLLGQGNGAAVALTGGFRWALWVSGLTALAAVPVAFTLIKGRNRSLTQKLHSGHPQSSRGIGLTDRPRVPQLLGLRCHSCASSCFRD